MSKRERERERQQSRADGKTTQYVFYPLYNVDKIDFIRDVVAYMCAVALVIGVAYDGDVSGNYTYQRLARYHNFNLHD